MKLKMIENQELLSLVKQNAIYITMFTDSCCIDDVQQRQYFTMLETLEYSSNKLSDGCSILATH